MRQNLSASRVSSRTPCATTNRGCTLVPWKRPWRRRPSPPSPCGRTPRVPPRPRVPHVAGPGRTEDRQPAGRRGTAGLSACLPNVMPWNTWPTRYREVKDLPVREVMTTNPVVLYETDPAGQALSAIAVAGYRHVPVLDIHGATWSALSAPAACSSSCCGGWAEATYTGRD